MNKKSIFVSGVHGVGKTTFTERLSKSLQLKHYSSSELIKKQNSSFSFPDKKIENVDKNQDILIESIKNHVKEKKFILDGHFTLLNTSNEIKVIPNKVFEELNMEEIYLLTLNETIIFDRLSQRGNNEITLNTIVELQKLEIERAYQISRELDIPIVHIPDVESVNKYFD